MTDAFAAPKDPALPRGVTISLGCASMIPGREVESAALIHAADELLYLAKRNGRNRVEKSA